MLRTYLYGSQAVLLVYDVSSKQVRGLLQAMPAAPEPASRRGRCSASSATNTHDEFTPTAAEL